MGGLGPRGLDPSQKQSIGVIQIHGMMASMTGSKAAAFPSRAGLAGLKQRSVRDHELKQTLTSSFSNHHLEIDREIMRG